MKKLFKNIRRDVSSITSFLVDFFDNFSWHPCHYRISRHVFSNHGTSTAFSPTVTPGKMVALAPALVLILFDDEDQADD